MTDSCSWVWGDSWELGLALGEDKVLTWVRDASPCVRVEEASCGGRQVKQGPDWEKKVEQEGAGPPTSGQRQGPRPVWVGLRGRQVQRDLHSEMVRVVTQVSWARSWGCFSIRAVRGRQSFTYVTRIEDDPQLDYVSLTRLLHIITLADNPTLYPFIAGPPSKNILFLVQGSVLAISWRHDHIPRHDHQIHFTLLQEILW